MRAPPIMNEIKAFVRGFTQHWALLPFQLFHHEGHNIPLLWRM
jgi:hypothetical protein